MNWPWGVQDNALQSAQANPGALEAVLTQARLTFARQQELLKNGWTPRANYDESQQKLLSAQAAVASSAAQVRIASEQQGFAVLHANGPGLSRQKAPSRAKWSAPVR